MSVDHPLFPGTVSLFSVVDLFFNYFAVSDMTVIEKALAKITGQFFVHRTVLSGIIISSSEVPFTKTEQALIQKFHDFIWKHAGPAYSGTSLGTAMKDTSYAFRWLREAKVPNVQEKLNQLDNYFTQISGLQQVMFNVGVLCAKRVLVIQKKDRSVHYKFEENLLVIYEAREKEHSLGDTPLIDLLHDNVNSV